LYQKQLRLGEELGIDYKNYPPPENFPYGYFSDILEPGMEKAEIHSVVTGYEKVIHCETREEIYYYYHSSDQKATRIMLIYDDQGKFKTAVPEDKDSLSFDASSCLLGLLEK